MKKLCFQNIFPLNKINRVLTIVNFSEEVGKDYRSKSVPIFQEIVYKERLFFLI